MRPTKQAASAVEINVPCFVVQSSRRNGKTLYVAADLNQELAAACAAELCATTNRLNADAEAVVRRGTARIELGDVVELEDIQAEFATAGDA